MNCHRTGQPTKNTKRPITRQHSLPSSCFAYKHAPPFLPTPKTTNSFVLVSNRGHNSIAVFAIKKTTLCGEAGHLSVVNYCHTKGRTPRHFQFDPTGQFLLSANQDTDSVTVFR